MAFFISPHRPHGAGHPYHRGDDERVPALPVEGEPVRLGVVPDLPLAQAVVEVEDGQRRRRLSLSRSVSVAVVTGAEGHLAHAQSSAESLRGWTVRIGSAPAERWRYRFHLTQVDGALVETPWYDVESARWEPGPACGRSGAVHCERTVPGSVSWLTTAAGVHVVRFALRLEPDEHVVGLGERYDAVDQRGRTVDLRVFEQYKSQWRTGYTYFPVPFAHVVGGEGWGFYVDTACRVRLDIAVSDPTLLRVDVDLGGPQERPEINVPVWQGDPHEVLAGYTALTGRSDKLPEWVFGLWASGNEWNSQAKVMGQVNRHRHEGVPVSVVVIEAWSDEEGFCVFRDSRYHGNPRQPYEYQYFEFPADGAWPDPAGMVSALHSQGVHVILWQIPLQKDEPELGSVARAQRDALLESGHLVRQEDGAPYRNRGWWFPGALMPDLSTQAGARWWTSWRQYLIADIGIDGFKTDGGEHAWGHDLRFADGSVGEQGANLFPVAYARAYGDLLRRLGRPAVTFSRAGFTGSQAQGAFWAGDEDSSWDAFRAAIRAGLTASACGVVYWGWDIAGFSGEVPEAELYLRAWGASVFMPIMQYHSEFNGHRSECRDRTPWNVAERWGRPEVVDVVRSLTLLRQRLRPYLAEQVSRAVHGGKPLMRALFFETQEPWIWDHQDHYLLGDDILVHPVTEPGAVTWQTRVPDGCWVDPWLDAHVPGGRIYERRYGLDEVPVLVRAQRWGDLRTTFLGDEGSARSQD